LGTEKSGPIISMIAAVDDRRNLAINGKLPWKKQLADKLYYLDKISGRTIIMGSNTFRAADHSREGNHIVVISRNSYKDFNLPEADVINSIEAIQGVIPVSKEDEVYITGGGIIFTAAEKNIADRIYLNIIHTNSKHKGNEIKFPELDTVNRWKLVSSTMNPSDLDNEFPVEFLVYSRLR
jgi:dihydrofolate reductase